MYAIRSYYVSDKSDKKFSLNALSVLRNPKGFETRNRSDAYPSGISNFIKTYKSEWRFSA